MTERHNQVDKFAEVLKLVGFTDGDLASMDRIFDNMSVAEEEIAKGKFRWPKNEDAVWNTFSMLMPSDFVRELPEQFYRAHCKEIIDRVGEMDITDDMKKIDLSLGTDAELCKVMSEAAFRNPLGRLHTKIYMDAFNRCVPDFTLDSDYFDKERPMYEEWPGQAKEEEWQIRARIAQDWRVLERDGEGKWRKKRDPND